MAKKGFGKIMALATIAGAAAVGISYLKKYKSFNKELEKEFHDFEGDEQDFFDDEDENQEEDGPFTADDSDFEDDDPFEEDEGISFSSADPTEEEGQPSRKYISLHADAYDVKLAAKDIFAAAGEMAGAAKNVLKDTAVILTDTAFEAAQAAKDAAQIARAKLGEKADSYRERQAAKEKESQEGSKDANPSPQKEEELSQDGVPQKPAAQNSEEDAGATSKEPYAAAESAGITIESEDSDEILLAKSMAANEEPAPIAGTAMLDAKNPDSTLEAIKPEKTQKAAPDGELTTVVEEID